MKEREREWERWERERGRRGREKEKEREEEGEREGDVCLQNCFLSFFFFFIKVITVILSWGIFGIELSKVCLQKLRCEYKLPLRKPYRFKFNKDSFMEYIHI